MGTNGKTRHGGVRRAFVTVRQAVAGSISFAFVTLVMYNPAHCSSGKQKGGTVDWHDVVFYTTGGPIVITCQSREAALDTYGQPPNEGGVIAFEGVMLRMGDRVIQAEHFDIEASSIIASALTRVNQ